MKYVGYCGPKISKPTEWGDGDVIGHLLVEEPDGWRSAGTYLSSSVGYSQGDVRYLYDHRTEPNDTDTYEWIGQVIDVDALCAAYPPAPATEPVR